MISLKLRTAAAAIILSLATAGVNAATLLDTDVDKDPFPSAFDPDGPGGLDPSPALAKCDTGYDESTGGEQTCTTWVDGGAVGDYSGAFDLKYTNKNTFTWSYDSTKVTDLGGTEVLFPFYILVKAKDIDAWSLLITEIDGGTLTASFDKAISHVSFFDGRDPGGGGTPKVPVPAGLPLMLTALGIGAYMRKRAQKSA